MTKAAEKGEQLRVYILGQTRVEVDGTPFRFKAVRKVLPLLGYLALRNRGPVGREQIAFTLWPDDEEESALANLRRNIYLLTRALPPSAPKRPWLLVDAADVQWNPEAEVWLDVIEFERLANEPQLESAEGAAALYAGELLDGHYEDWIFSERERLRSIYVRILGQLVDDRRRKRDLGSAIGFARRILAADAWREDTLRTLMSLRYESGDGAGALAEFDAFAKRLRQEMSVEPMPETVAVRERIARNAELVEPLAPSEDAPVAHLDRRALPFVDRENELSQLRTAWSRASRRAGGFVLAGGEAGIGKTRLLDEFAYEVENQGARVLRGMTGVPEAAPYQALAEAFASVLPVLVKIALNPIWLAAIAQVVPELRARRNDLPALPGLPADREQTRLQEAFVATLEAIGRGRPTLVVLEDLHHAGEATLAAIEEIARRTSGSTVMLVATYREDETTRSHPLRRLRRRLSERGLVQFLSPTPLPRSAIDQLVELVPALTAAGKNVANALQERSEGNALFLSEAIRDILEGGDGTGTGVRATISARLARLGGEARTFADSAAVAGVTFDVELVRDVTSWTEDVALEALDELLDRSIVREAGSSKRYSYEFSHRLVQTTIYDELPEEVRIRRHRRVARVLEERSGTSSADLAFHYERGRVPGLAARHYLSAAEAALALGATDDALAYDTRGLALAEDSALRLPLLFLRERLHGLRGERGAQLEDLDLLALIEPSLGDRDARLEILIRRAALDRATGRIEDERQWLDHLHSAVAEGAGTAWELRAGLAEAQRDLATAAYPDATLQATRARQLAEDAGDRTGLLEALCILAEAAARQGRLEDAEAYLGEAQHTATAIGRREALARATTQAMRGAAARQAYPEAKVLSESALSIYREIGDRLGEAETLNALALIESRLGDLVAEQRSLASAIAVCESIGNRQGLANAYLESARLELRLGRLANAELLLIRASEAYEALNDARGRTNCDVNLSFIAAARGDFGTARARGEAALADARRLGIPMSEAVALGNMGIVERQAGNLDFAIAHLEHAIAMRSALRSIDLLEDRVELAFAMLLAKREDDALQLAEELARAPQAEVAGLVWPFYLPWVIAQIFASRAERSADAKQFGERAVRELGEYASVMDPDARDAFLALPLSRKILS